jgi:hypothetical protein
MQPRQPQPELQATWEHKAGSLTNRTRWTSRWSLACTGTSSSMKRGDTDGLRGQMTEVIIFGERLSRKEEGGMLESKL